MNRSIETVRAVDGVNLDLGHCEILGLVGESGCGKSTLARSILNLVPITNGEVIFDGKNLADMSRRELRKIRTNLQMIFQDPYASLNPRMTVFDAIAEPMLVHGLVKRKEAAAHVSALMENVGLAPRFMRKYPHEFSGGQRQRIAIARALAVNPRLIIADEPVSALDVSVQAQILNLLGKLCSKSELTMILISHDLAVVKHLAHRIAVMYLGRIIEIGEANNVFTKPLHPYTQMLIKAIPQPDPRHEYSCDLMKGDPPSPLHPPSGCHFHPRCPFADEQCAKTTPILKEFPDKHSAACLKVEEIQDHIQS